MGPQGSLTHTDSITPRPEGTGGAAGTATLAAMVCALPAAGLVAGGVALVMGEAVRLPLTGHHFVAAGLALGGAAGSIACTRIMLRRVRNLSMIGRALCAYHAGEPDLGTLRLADDTFPENLGWNLLIDRLEQSVAGQTAARVDAKLAATTPQAAQQSATLDALPHGILLLSDELRVTAVNGASCRLLMRSRERLMGAPLDKLIEDAGLLRLVRQLAQQPDARGGVCELTLTHEGEAVATLRCTVRPVGKGDARSVLVVLEDVTQQRTADKSRNLFVAQATHELRTPLTNIGLYVERAIDLADDAVTDRAECLNVINSEVLRLSRLVEEVLSVSEIEAGSLKVRRDDLKLDTVVEQMRQEYAPQAAAKKIELTFDLPPKLPTLQGDRDKIAMAIHNLLGNALKYTPAGGKVRFELDGTDQAVGIRVADTGIGIGEADLPRVFEKFYRAQDERLRDIAGSGLGLALAREVVRLHGGDITVESVLNHGSTFTLTLPLHKPAQV